VRSYAPDSDSAMVGEQSGLEKVEALATVLKNDRFCLEGVSCSMEQDRYLDRDALTGGFWAFSQAAE